MYTNALVTALLSSTMLTHAWGRVAAIDVPYISAWYIVCGPGVRALMRILPLTRQFGTTRGVAERVGLK